MKRLNCKKTILPLFTALILFASPVSAGVNYIQYHENFQMQKEMKNSAPSKEGKHFQRRNKYIREQEKNTPMSSSGKNCDPNRTVSKYDRCYWNPTQ